MSSSDPVAAGRRFLIVTLATTALLLGGIIAATALTDPTGLLAAGGWSGGICAPGVKSMDDRTLKPVMAAVHRPDQIILGSSRVVRGFDARGLRPEDGVVLNLGMTGATMTDIDAIARGAVEEAPIRRIWIGLDFGAVAMAETSLIDPSRPEPFVGSRSASLRHGLLSPEALKATLGLARHPAACATPPFDARAFVNPLAGDLTRPRAALPDGPTRARVLRSWRLAPARRGAVYAARMAELDRLLLHLHDHGVDVVLYRSPSHPAYDALVAEAGLAPLHRRWQADTDRLAARFGLVLIAADAPDFLSELEVPRCSGVRTDCAFDDAVHFRPEVGAAILRAGRVAQPARKTAPHRVAGSHSATPPSGLATSGDPVSLD